MHSKRPAPPPAHKEDGSGDGGSPQLVQDILSGKDTTSYLVVNLMLYRCAALLRRMPIDWLRIRYCFSLHMLKACRGINDIGNSTLLLLGGVGTGTGLHLDLTEARNIAFSVGDRVVSTKKTLAKWVFINPLMLKVADKFIRSVRLTAGKRKRGEDAAELKWPNGLMTSADKRVHLEGTYLTQFLKHMKREGEKMTVANPVVQLDQKAGQLVHVPAGWVHQVTNVKCNVKVAWDFYDPGNMHKYVQVQRLASKFFKRSMAPDYMSVNMVLQQLANGH